MEIIFSENEIPSIVENLFKKILNFSNNKNATILLLEGELGVGKTTLTKELSKYVEVREKIISPTFTIMKSYDIKNNKKNLFKKLIHIDAYRISNSEEFLDLGWQDIISYKHNFVVIEWPSNIEKIIPKDSIKIYLSHLNNNLRKIRF